MTAATPAESAVGNAEQARLKCELCGNEIKATDSRTSSWGLWSYHTKCWNDAYTERLGYDDEQG